MSDHVLLPVLQDFKNRLERIENMLKQINNDTEEKTDQEKSLAMDEIHDYLQKINMA